MVDRYEGQMRNLLEQMAELRMQQGTTQGTTSVSLDPSAAPSALTDSFVDASSELDNAKKDFVIVTGDEV